MTVEALGIGLNREIVVELSDVYYVAKTQVKRQPIVREKCVFLVQPYSPAIPTRR